MEKVKITKDTLRKAKTYMPIADKAAYAKAIAKMCVIPTDGETVPLQGTLTLPPLYAEDAALKAVSLEAVVFEYYFGIEVPEEFTGDDFDEIEADHPMNRIERLKSDPDVKDAAFDLLADIRELKKIVDSACYGRKNDLNDPIGRIFAAFSEFSNPENIEKAAKRIEEVADAVKEKAEGSVFADG